MGRTVSDLGGGKNRLGERSVSDQGNGEALTGLGVGRTVSDLGIKVF